jgi:hypothetical protein
MERLGTADTPATPHILDLDALQTELITVENDPALDFFSRHKSVSAILRDKIIRASKHISSSDCSINLTLAFYKQLEVFCASRRQWGQQSACLLYTALAYRRTGQFQKASQALKLAYKMATEQDDEYLGSILATMSADQLTGEVGTDPVKGNYLGMIIGIELGKKALGQLHKESIRQLDWNLEPFCKLFRRDKVDRGFSNR